MAGFSGIAKVLVSFFREGDESAIERYRSRVPLDSAKQTDVRSLKKHLIAFLGIKEQSERFGLGSFEFKFTLLGRGFFPPIARRKKPPPSRVVEVIPVV